MTKTHSVKAFNNLSGITFNQYEQLSQEEQESYYEDGSIKGNRAFFPKRHGTYNTITKKEAALLGLRVFTEDELADEIQTSKRALMISEPSCFYPFPISGHGSPEVGILDDQKGELYFDIIYDYSKLAPYIPSLDEFSLECQNVDGGSNLKWVHKEYKQVGCTWSKMINEMVLVYSLEEFIKANNLSFISRKSMLPGYLTNLMPEIPGLSPIGHTLDFKGALKEVYDIETFRKQKNLPLYRHNNHHPSPFFLTGEYKSYSSFYEGDEIGIEITNSGSVKYVYSLQTLCEKLGYEFLTQEQYKEKEYTQYFSKHTLSFFPNEWGMKQKAQMHAIREDGKEIFTFPGSLSSLYPIQKATFSDLVIPLHSLLKFKSFVKKELGKKINFNILEPYAITENNELLFNTKSNELLQKVKLKVMFESFYRN